METKSIFYQERYDHRFPIPLLTYEVIEFRLTEMDEDPDEATLIRTYIEIIKETCGVSSPTDADVNYFILTVNKLMAEAQKLMEKSERKAKEDKGKAKVKRGFSSDFYESVSKLSTDELILNATNFDLDKARYLYNEVDRSLAMKVVDKYLDRLQHEHRIMLESAVYGFGGDMGEGSGTVETEIDMESGAGAKDMFAAMNRKI